MSAIQDILNNSKKIVIKIGSNVLSDDKGYVKKGAIDNIVDQIYELIKVGKSVVIVSSGAGACGMGTIHKWSRKGDLHYRQALCSIGQVELMMAYKESFAKFDIHVGQILLTAEDLEDTERTLRIRNTLFTLVDENVVPIINENDSVSVEEIRIGDNDTLSARVVTLWDADALVMLSNIDGIYDKNPSEFKEAKLIEEIYDIDAVLCKIDTQGTSSFGTGGVQTKIKAARKVGEYSIPAMILNGTHKDIILKAMKGEAKGTVFYGSKVW